ncbi:MAG: methyltransferase domain-containing protein [Anaerolineaceae bacterium]|nr:methyltransferase domain-containing protein [Anaerolineaceae bacterium]
MEFTGERFIPGAGSEELSVEHYTRYQFARQFAFGKRVLDAACGSGYGSKILAEEAKEVYGIDISSEAVAYAKEEYGAENIVFSQASIAKLPFQDNFFDLIVSYETLEHVDEDTQNTFLHEIRRTLTPGGILVMSTPNRDIYDKRGENDFHVHELSFHEFEGFLRGAFRHVYFFSQVWELSNGILNRKDSIATASGGLLPEGADYLIAVCSDTEITGIQSRVTVREDGKYAQLMEWAIDNHNRNEINVRRIAEVTEKNEQLTGIIKSLTESEQKLNAQLTEKNAKVLEFEQLKQSRSWRLLETMWKVRDVLIPYGSYRRQIAKKLVKDPSHILSLFKPLTIPDCSDPTVSIVIPAYNQFGYTYGCIRSIIENSGDVPYEVILADDCSTDLTRIIHHVVHGLHVVRNKENLRFLRNCNHAAKSARGKYILFLNNDTEVQKYWLIHLVKLIESADDIGMVGSKLVYPDGRLQEAGGIIWRDGTGWNYGRGGDPNASEYNYVKEVDYISGAAIMIRRSLWEEIGGFDERFAPAYCEDSDLAFEVRKHGYRVMYQPLSTVIHFEGVSNGTDLSAGQKAYQIANQKKLYEKWKTTLNVQHFPVATDVFHARDRSREKETILFIDHYVPTFDKDAGSRTIYQYLDLLCKMGYHVVFIGDNFASLQPYTSILQQMGIEVLYGPFYENNWRAWIKNNGYAIDVAFLNRPYVAERYIDSVRELTNARIIYNVCDLTFVRKRKEYEITGNPAELEASEASKKTELAMIEKADVSFTLSADEKRIIDEYFPSEKSVVAPINVYSDFQEKLPERTNTKDLLFVGGFNHNPNVDAVLWFCSEVLPDIIKEIPDIIIRVAGSYPPIEVLKLASEHVYIEGYVTDEKLEDLYKQSRICVIPLRFGAGVKGKTIEAMYRGIPIVTTSTGIEGLPDIQECLTPYDDAESFANEVVRIYRHGAQEQTEKNYQYVREHFSEERVRDFFLQEFRGK